MREPIKKLFGSVNYGVSIHVDESEFSKDMISVISFYLKDKKIKAEGCKSVYDLAQQLKKFWNKVSTIPDMEINDRRLAGWLEDYFKMIGLKKVKFRTLLETIREPYTPVEEDVPKILPSYRLEQKAEGMDDTDFFQALELVESLETEEDLEVAIHQETLEKQSIYDEIISLLRENEGRIRYSFLKKLMDINEEELKRSIHELKVNGEICEPEPGKIRLLQQVLIEEEGFYLGPLIRE